VAYRYSPRPVSELSVQAWDSPNPSKPQRLDVAHYRVLLFRASKTILEPFGVNNIEDWLKRDKVKQLELVI